MLTTIAVLILAIGVLIEFTLSSTLGVLGLVAGILAALELLQGAGVTLRR